MVYIRSGGVFAFLFGIFLILLAQLSWLGCNLWMADWSSDAKKLAANSTADAPMSLDVRLGTYATIGFTQGRACFPALLRLAEGMRRSVSKACLVAFSCI